MTYLILGRLTMWRLLRIVGLLAGLGFMGWLLARLVTNPHLLQGQLAIIGFIEAVVIGIIANAGVSIVFSDMVGKSAPDIGLGKRFTAFYYAQIAKYIPGRIAALMVQRSVLTGPNGTTATITSNIELMAVSSWLCGGAAHSDLSQPPGAPSGNPPDLQTSCSWS